MEQHPPSPPQQQQQQQQEQEQQQDREANMSSDDFRDLNTIISNLTFEERAFEDRDEEEEDDEYIIRTVASCDPPGSVADEMTFPPSQQQQQQQQQIDQDAAILMETGAVPQRQIISPGDDTDEEEEELEGCGHEEWPGRPYTPVPVPSCTSALDEECPSPVAQDRETLEECPSSEIHYQYTQDTLDTYFQNNQVAPGTPDTESLTPSASPSVSESRTRRRENVISVGAKQRGSSIIVTKGLEYYRLPDGNHSASTSAAAAGKPRKSYRNAPGVKSLRTTPVWMLMVCAFLLVALVGVALWSYHTVAHLNKDIDYYETTIDSLSLNTTAWTSKALGAEEVNDSLENQLANREDRVAALEADKTALLAQVAGLQSQVHGLNQNVQTLETDKAILKLNVFNLEAKNEEWQQLHAQMQSSMDAMREMNSNLNMTRLSLEYSVASLLNQLDLMSNRNGDLNATRLQLLDEISSFTQAVTELELRNAELDDLRAKLEEDKEQLELIAIPTLNGQIQQCAAELHVTQANLASCRADVASLQTAVAGLEADNQTCHAKHAVCQDDRAHLSGDLSACDLQKDTCQTNLTACQTDLADEAARYVSCNAERNELKFSIVPDLDDQVARLEGEAITLRSELDALEDLNAIYFTLNGKLNETVGGLENLRDELNATKISLEEQVHELNHTILDLEDVKANLTAQLDDFRVLTSTLNDTKNDLILQVASLNGAVDDLNLQNQALQQNIQDLNGQVSALQETRLNLQQDVADLERERHNLTDLVDLLEVRIDQLAVVSSFIENNTAAMEKTYDSILAGLSSQISLSRDLAMRQLHNFYADASFSWDCSVHDRFGGSPWLYDSSIDIPRSDLTRVITLVERNLLRPMCLSRSDFEDFLADSYGGLDSVAWDDVTQGTVLYSEAAREYYFPLPGDPGLTIEQWEAAGYTCENVPPFQL